MELVVEEMRRTLATFERDAEEWRVFATSPPPGISAIDDMRVAGIGAYAHKQANIRERMFIVFVDDWYHLLRQLPFKLPWLQKNNRPSKTKRRRLVSLVKLYHPNSYDPQIQPFGTDGTTSDDYDHDDGLRNTTVEDLEDFITSNKLLPSQHRYYPFLSRVPPPVPHE